MSIVAEARIWKERRRRERSRSLVSKVGRKGTREKEGSETGSKQQPTTRKVDEARKKAVNKIARRKRRISEIIYVKGLNRSSCRVEELKVRQVARKGV